MLLSPERLAAQLERDGPKPVYVLFGEEPLQLVEAADRIRAATQRAGIRERLRYDVESGFDWQALLASSANLSLFAERRLVEIHLPGKKPDKTGAAVITELAARDASEDVLLVTAGNLERSEQQAAWFKACDGRGVVVACKPLDPPTFKRWIGERAAGLGKRLSPEATELIAIRAEGNLLAAAQELDKLALMSDAADIDEATALAAVSDNARYDLFKLVDVAVAGDTAKALRMVRGLAEEGTEPVMIGWALNRELRTLAEMAVEIARGDSAENAMQRHKVWSNRQGMVRRLLARYTAPALVALLRDSIQADWVVKGARSGNAWDELECLVLALAGGPRLRPAPGRPARTRGA
ncbi:MAG: DNA polymerase III subunit delta [Gammaproteobacteria bacterium]|nr:DNA polymerase III subunit delta [Gammaproteobacteria bacterium]